MHVCERYVQICQVGGQRVPSALILQLEVLIYHLVFVVGPESDQLSFWLWMSLLKPRKKMRIQFITFHLDSRG